jgi:protein gp37
MGDKTGISWTDATWNCVRGCSRVSEGCRNCYAERVAARFSDEGMPYHGLADRSRKGSKWTGVVRLIPEHLADPLRWKKPRRIFVNSMSDLFHEGLTNEQIAAVFGVMAAAPQHTFQVLTKRATRMREWFDWVKSKPNGRRPGVLLTDALDTLAKLDDAADARFVDAHWQASLVTSVDGSDAGWTTPARWPLPNVWLGVSVENQAAADERIPELLRTPAAVRFLSCEPLIGPVTLDGGAVTARGTSANWLRPSLRPGQPPQHDVNAISWVIAGCESGPGARPCSVEWLRSLRDQCAAAGVPFFLKQAAQPGSEAVGGPLLTPGDGSKRKAGGVIELPYLDGVQHASFPEVP